MHSRNKVMQNEYKDTSVKKIELLASRFLKILFTKKDSENWVAIMIAIAIKENCQ